MPFIFHFPLSPESIEQVNSLNQLKSILEHQLRSDEIYSYLNYRFKLVNGIYLYAKCSQCACSLSYRKDSDIFSLKKFNNVHKHSKKKGQKILIMRMIQEIPLQLGKKYIKNLIQQKFQISDSTFYRIYAKTQQKTINFRELANQLNQTGCIGIYEPVDMDIDSNCKPDIFIGTSKKMINAFSKFGQFCTFDFTYNIISKQKQQPQFRVGCFIGVSGTGKILPFAFVICNQQTSQIMARIFTHFFRLMNNSPKSIITDQQKSFECALKSLKYEGYWNGEHLLDIFHILKNYREKLKIKRDINIFKQAAFAENTFQFQAIISNAQFQSENDACLFEKFIQKSNLYCLSQVPDNFVGFSICSSIGQKTNDLIKRKIPFSQSFEVVCKKLYDIFQNLTETATQVITLQKFPVENYYNIDDIKVVRSVTCAKIIKKLCLQIKKSFNCLLNQKENHFEVQDEYGKHIISYQSQKYKCSCRYHIKTGIPCQHLLKILLIKRLPILSYISDRWNHKPLVLNEKSTRLIRRVTRKKRL